MPTIFEEIAELERQEKELEQQNEGEVTGEGADTIGGEEGLSEPADEEGDEVGEVEELPEETPEPDDKAKKQQAYEKRQAARKEREERERQLIEDKYRAEKDAEVAKAQLQMAQPKREVVEDVEPDIEFDPQAWKQWNQRQVDAKLSKAEQIASQAMMAVQVAEAKQALAQNENEFAENQKDFFEAKKYLKQSYMAELKLAHPKASEAQLRQIVEDSYLKGAAHYAAISQDPATSMYEIAKARGYRTEAKPEPKGDKPNPKPSMAALRDVQSRTSRMHGQSAQGKTGKLSLEEALALPFDKFAALEEGKDYE